MKNILRTQQCCGGITWEVPAPHRDPLRAQLHQYESANTDHLVFHSVLGQLFTALIEVCGCFMLKNPPIILHCVK